MAIEAVSEPHCGQVSNGGTGSTFGPTQLTLVDGVLQSKQREDDQCRSRGTSGDGCQPVGLGGSVERSSSSGQMVGHRGSTADKSAGVKGHKTGAHHWESRLQGKHVLV